MAGFFFAYLTENYLGKIIPASWQDNLILSLLLFFIPFSVLIISYLVHIIIHELGHLIFGLATGYSFVSFRIGSFTIIREDGKFKKKKYYIPGTAGQCLMMPPEVKDGEFPFIIYNLGGVLLNGILSLAAIFAVAYIDNMNLFLESVLILFFTAGIFVVLTNGIPMKISGMPNDAFNVVSILKDKETKKAFYLQLRVNGLLSQGIRYKDMDYSLFHLEEGADLSNPLNTSTKLMEYNWHLDNMDFDRARQVLDLLLPIQSKIIALFRNEIKCERIFLELIGDSNKEFIDRLYSKELERYIKASKFLINKKRLLMAYEAFYNEDKEKALEYYKEIVDLYNDYPIKGEADMELMLGDWIKDRV